MSNADQEVLELDLDAQSLLDRELDDIEDLPGFECPVDGQYILNFKTSLKKVNDLQAVEASFEVVECLKKDNDSDPDTIPGTKFSTLHFLQVKPGGNPEGPKFAIDALKKYTKPIAEQVGDGNLLRLVKEHCANGVILSATVTGKKDKENPEIRRPRLSNISAQ